LDHLKQLRERLENEPSPSVNEPKRMHTVLRSIEQRLNSLEERLVNGPPSSRRTPSRMPSANAEELSDCVFSGLIQGQMLSDMLQLVSSNALTGVFVVENDRLKASLYFEEGRICHASGAGLEGEQAFFTAFGFEQGRYYFRETTQLPEQRTITSNTQFLILEALRQIDESRA
jgi:hypothetical protein